MARTTLSCLAMRPENEEAQYVLSASRSAAPASKSSGNSAMVVNLNGTPFEDVIKTADSVPAIAIWLEQ